MATSDLPLHAAPLTLLSEEEELFRDSVRDFAREAVGPRVHSMDESERMDPALIGELFQMGLMGIQVPEELGGSGASFFSAILIVEELSRVDPSVGVLVDVQNTLVNNALLRWGSREIQERWLPQLCTEVVGAYALSEAGSGSDAFALSTRAQPVEGGYRLTGRKLWITNGAEAGLYLIFANVDPSAGYRGITAFLVEREAEGFTIGKREEKLGIRASSTTELILEEVFVPADAVVGTVGQGYRVAIETLNEGRIGIGAQMVGLAQGALDATLRYVGEREQFGRSIGEFQGVQFQLARMATELEAARLLVYNAARLKDAGRPFLREAAMAKLFASEAAQRIASGCVDLFGGYGFTREYPVEKFYRDSKIGTIYEGDAEVRSL